MKITVDIEKFPGGYTIAVNGKVVNTASTPAQVGKRAGTAIKAIFAEKTPNNRAVDNLEPAPPISGSPDAPG